MGPSRALERVRYAAAQPGVRVAAHSPNSNQGRAPVRAGTGVKTDKAQRADPRAAGLGCADVPAARPVCPPAKLIMTPSETINEPMVEYIQLLKPERN